MDSLSHRDGPGATPDPALDPASPDGHRTATAADPPSPAAPSPEIPSPEASSPESLRRVANVLEIALDLDPALRASYLEAMAAEDPQIVERVRALIRERGAGEGAASADSPAAPELGDDDRLGPYRVVGILGSGGMGHVFLAERADGEVERQVAIKVLGAGFHSPLTHQRFLSERQILAVLDHPNIAKMFDAGTADDGRAYLVMEVIEGRPIDQYCDEGNLSLDERLDLFLDVCSAVEHAHQRLIVHRDLKPSNILVARGPDGQAVPKLLDFGIAKLLAPETFPLPLHESTQTVHRALTPGWASPEQLRGEVITTATDVYALGLLLYRLLAGTLPHDPDVSMAKRLSQLFGEEGLTRPSSRVVRVPTSGSGSGTGDAAASPTDPSGDSAHPSAARRQWARHLEGDLDNIVLEALQAEPGHRYPSVAALAADVRRYLDGAPVHATRGSWRYRTAKLVKRRKWPLATSVLALAFLLGLSGLRSQQARRIGIERDAAQSARVEAESEARLAELTRDFLSELLAAANEDSRLGREVRLHSLLEIGLERLDSPEIEDPRARARLLEVLGDAFDSLGDRVRAAQAYQGALHALEDSTTADPARCRLWSQLGYSLERAGDWGRARDALVEGLSIRGPGCETWKRRSLLRLAWVESGVGRQEISLGYTRRALEGLDPEAPGELTIVRTAMASWMIVASNVGQPADLEPLCDQVFPLAALGGGDVESAFRLAATLGLACPAQPWGLRSAELALQLALGHHHFDDTNTAFALFSLAARYIAAGRFDQAEELIDRGFESAEAGVAQKSSPMARFYLTYGEIHRAALALARGLGAESQRGFAAAAQQLEGMVLTGNPTYPNHMYTVLLIRLGRLDEARQRVHQLVEAGWFRRDLIDLARSYDLLPDPMPIPEPVDLALPDRIRQYLESLPRPAEDVLAQDQSKP